MTQEHSLKAQWGWENLGLLHVAELWSAEGLTAFPKQVSESPAALGGAGEGLLQSKGLLKGVHSEQKGGFWSEQTSSWC